MAATTTPHPKNKFKTSVKRMKADGMKTTDIVRLTGLSYDTINKYLKQATEDQLAIDTFKDNLSALLHTDLLLGMELKHKLLISLGSDDISTLTVAEKRNIISTLSTSNGITFDKIRLQDGKSTVNSSHRIQLESVHRTLYVDEDTSKQGSQVGTTKGKTRAIMETDGAETTQAIDNIEITEDAT